MSVVGLFTLNRAILQLVANKKNIKPIGQLKKSLLMSNTFRYSGN